MTFLGAIPHSDVAQFIKSLELFVLPCKQDKDGDIDGVPVISTRLSGTPELIIDAETGLIAEPGQVDDLVLAIKK